MKASRMKTQALWSELAKAEPSEKVNLFIDLFEALVEDGSEEKFAVGFSTRETLLEEKCFNEFFEMSRKLALELIGAERFIEAEDVIVSALNHEIWVSNFESGMLRWVYAGLLRKLERPAEASLELLQAGFTLTDEDKTVRGYLERERADCLEEIDEVEEAKKAFALAVDLFEQDGFLEGAAFTKRDFGHHLVENEQFTMAVKYLQDALGMFEFLNYPAAIQSANLLLGRAFLGIDSFASASEHLNKAQENKEGKLAQAVAAEASFYNCVNLDKQGFLDDAKSGFRLMIPILRACNLLELAETSEIQAG